MPSSPCGRTYQEYLADREKLPIGRAGAIEKLMADTSAPEDFMWRLAQGSNTGPLCECGRAFRHPYHVRKSFYPEVPEGGPYTGVPVVSADMERKAALLDRLLLDAKDQIGTRTIVTLLRQKAPQRAPVPPKGVPTPSQSHAAHIAALEADVLSSGPLEWVKEARDAFDRSQALQGEHEGQLLGTTEEEAQHLKALARETLNLRHTVDRWQRRSKITTRVTFMAAGALLVNLLIHLIMTGVVF